MAIDLSTGISAITVLSALAFFVGRQLNADRGSGRPICFAVSLVLTLLFAWAFAGKLGWAAVLPITSVIFSSNLMPLLLSFTAGLASSTPGLGRWHRPATITALSLLAMAYAITPVARPWVAPVQVDAVTQWRGNVCLQSHSSTCAPAAAVSLLRLKGIEATERGLVDACLTSRHGTEPLGLYRGLAASSKTHGVRARVASPNPDRWIGEQQLPNIALVRFADSHHHGSLRRLLGPRGEGHAVVVLGRETQGSWSILDPAFGGTTWTDQEFRSRFTGDAIYLADAK